MQVPFGVLVRQFAVSRGRILAAVETFRLSVGIALGSAGRRSRTLDVAHVVYHAIADPARRVSIAVPLCPATCFGAVHIAILVPGAIAPAAYDVAIGVLGAIGSASVRAGEKQHATTDDQSISHFVPFRQSVQAMILTPPSTYIVSPDIRRAYGVAR